MSLHLDPTSSVLAKPFLAMLPKHKAQDETAGHFEHVLLEDLYEPLRGLYNVVQNNKSSKLIKEKLPASAPKMPLPRMLQGDVRQKLSYMPSVIYDYLVDQETTCLQQLHYTYEHLHFHVAVYDRSLPGPTEDELCLLIAWLLYARNMAPSHCNMRLDIYLYMTPFVKETPLGSNEVLSPLHVNTGFTQACSKENEIVIYRHEEWFKVTLHESIHAFNLDPEHNEYFEAKLHDLILVGPTVKFTVSEMYTEVWARILTVVLKCLHQSPKDAETFLLYATLCLEVERLFALYQRDKVLAYMQLNYANLIDPRSAAALQQFQQNTHVLSYYVLASVCMAFYPSFLVWCDEHNGSDAVVKFDNGNNLPFFTFLSQHFARVPMQLTPRKSNVLTQTLRMSVFGGGRLE
jgi:hypothetical protein